MCTATCTIADPGGFECDRLKHSTDIDGISVSQDILIKCYRIVTDLCEMIPQRIGDIEVFNEKFPVDLTDECKLQLFDQIRDRIYRQHEKN
jgi:hypothetical protein